MNPEPYITVENLTFQYHSRTEPAIIDLSFEVFPGEVLLIAGSSGCGKTTLMRCINGLIPHTYRGQISGIITLLGQPISSLSMADLSQTVGTLLQDPERQIVGSYVKNEVAFGLENLGVSRDEIIRRVDETLEYLGILHLRDRETFSISGGEKQKVALAGVLVMQPQVLLLDEPLSSLDPASAHEALRLFRELADRGIAVMIVEHRVEDVLSINPERVLYLDEGCQKYYGSTDGLMDVVDYHRIKLPADIVVQRAKGRAVVPFEPLLTPQPGEPLVKFENVSFRYRDDLPDVLHDISFDVKKGDVIAILGHNGAGKTTLVKHALGLLKPTSGRVLLEGKDTQKVTVAQAAHTIGYVFQSPT
ncbi:MAG: ABC transporter ATP-binding protein, partial [Leptolinea sp.]|nr:ABC transporter ATP-binding protein [Leptolinea sp.]